MTLTKKQIISVILLLAIIFALPVAIFLTRKKQDIRPKALQGLANFQLQLADPNDLTKATVGKNIDVVVFLELTDKTVKVSGVDFLLLYDKDKLDVGNIVPNVTSVNPSAPFTDAPIVTSGGSFPGEDGKYNFIRVAQISRKADADLPKDTFQIARITFRGRATGGQVIIKFPDDNKYLQVVGTGTDIPPISMPPSPPNTPIAATITPGGPTLTPTPSPDPSLKGRIQGRRNQVGEVTGPVTITVNGVGSYNLAKHWDSYSTNDVLPLGSSYTVTSSPLSGHRIFYSICYNCIDHPESSYLEGPSVNVTIPAKPSNYYTGYVDLYWKYVPLTASNTIPNCLNLSVNGQTGAGPFTIPVSQAATLQAQFYSPANNVGGIFYVGQGATEIWNTWPPQGVSGNPGLLTATWTPTTAGTYQLSCRAWNDGTAECRGNPSDVDEPPRYTCLGPGSYKTVIVQ